MSEVSELQSYVYGVLRYATSVFSEEELRASLKAGGLIPERIDFVMKVAEGIMRFSSNLETRSNTSILRTLNGTPLLFSFIDAPDREAEHRFRIEFDLLDTGEQSLTMDPVKIKP